MVTAGSADGIILSGVAREMEAVPRDPWKLRRRKCLDYTPSVLLEPRPRPTPKCT